jgi:hypothetical protein
MTTNAQRSVAASIRREQKRTKDALTLSPALASKLASVVVHAEEMFSTHGHYFDKLALEQALGDPEVLAWLKALGPLAPEKRFK